MNDLLPTLDIESAAAIDHHHMNNVESIAPANASTLQPSRSLDAIHTQITPDKTVLRSDTFLKEEHANSSIDNKELLSKLFSKTFECIGDNGPTEYHSLLLLPIKQNSISQPTCYSIVENHVANSKSFSFKSSRGFCGNVLSFPVSHEGHYTAKSFISKLIEKKQSKKLKQQMDAIFQKFYDDHKIMEQEPAVNLVDVSDCAAFQDRYALSSSALLCSIAKCFELYADRYILAYADEIGRVEQVEDDETLLNLQQRFMEDADKSAKMERMKAIASTNGRVHLHKVHIHSEVYVEIPPSFQYKSDMESAKSDSSHATNASSPKLNKKETKSQLLLIINGYYSIFSSKFQVSTPDGVIIGTVSSSFSFHMNRLTIYVKNKILKTKYIISNKNTDVSRAFHIIKKGRRFKNGRRKAKYTCTSCIVKQSSGFMNELVAPLDNVVIDFPENCDPLDQALLFAAALLIEYKM
ncbi:hypothetical protein C9374_014640 [Naegleria lovaniensis]|uniref:Phospholipid scramblase n=1 Tax=Naegleria lovaniensis TaxID=51637 RepID=A0AA88GUN5_NAELO|nr:uncharacterized protein C9374_014640 [Naegleria lovaniensis]KAG2389240.1 hypothetical protein C9374_014640 [Naegleria lovaniensis]